MEILINQSKIQNDNFVGVWVCYDFEEHTGYDVYVTYTDEREIPNYCNSKYCDYFELIARKIPNLEKAEHIAKVFSGRNNLIYKGDVSPNK